MRNPRSAMAQSAQAENICNGMAKNIADPFRVGDGAREAPMANQMSAASAKMAGLYLAAPE